MSSYKLTFHSDSHFAGLADWLKGYFGIPDSFQGNKSKNSLCIEIDMNGEFFEATGVNKDSPCIGRNARISFERAGVKTVRLENENGTEIPTSKGARRYFICIKETLALFHTTLTYISKTTDDAVMVVRASDDLPSSSVQHMINLRFSDEEKDVAVAVDRVFLIGDGVRVGYNAFMMDFVPIVSPSTFENVYNGGGDANRVELEVDGERLKMLSDTMKIVEDTSGEDKVDAIVNITCTEEGMVLVSDNDGAFSVRLGWTKGANIKFSIPVRRGDISAFLFGNDSSSKKATMRLSVNKREANKPRIISAHVLDGHTGEEARYFIVESVHTSGTRRI